jgi:hypothetical protein
MAEAMGAMDINGRRSIERQRRPTDASKASQQSSGSSSSRQGNQNATNETPQQHVQRPSLPEDRGPPQRTSTLPQEHAYHTQSYLPQTLTGRRSRRTEGWSRPALATRRSGYGTPPRGGCCASSTAIRAPSLAWRSRRTGG